MVGTTSEQIADIMGFSINTLYKYYKPELQQSRALANANVAASLYKQAIEGNTTAQIFWLKTQAKWRETEHLEVEIRGIVSDKPMSEEDFFKKYENVIDAEDYMAASTGAADDTD